MIYNKTILIIPARGGSKNIPRKNLRPLNGKPLIYYTIKSALQSKLVDHVIVSTEDKEIALFSKRFGADVLSRPSNLAMDDVSLDPVIVHAVNYYENYYNYKLSYIITIQPTSPLISSIDIDNVITKLIEESADTVISVCEDKHLRWKVDKGIITPDYQERVNRQFLPDQYRETGAIIACKRNVLETGSRIGKKVSLYIMDYEKSIDIDSYNDLWLCELILKRKLIVIVVTGNADVGMGHTYRTLMLANELINHKIIFVCDSTDYLAVNYISQFNYEVKTAAPNQLIEVILKQKPDMVINDILDTSNEYIINLKNKVRTVINFEDLGEGAEKADLVINSLYPNKSPQKNMLFGPKYFILRDEFIHIKNRNRSAKVKNIFISFGGVDKEDFTVRILKLVSELTKTKNISIYVVVGPGYQYLENLKFFALNSNHPSIKIILETNKISEYMNASDIGITSAGRTALELYSLKILTIVIPQNFRETQHTFITNINGFISLGDYKNFNDNTFCETFSKILVDPNYRSKIIGKMDKINLRLGKYRVMEIINSLLQNKFEYNYGS
ncbi:NeuA4: N-acetylneuraminate cytidylyltransferase [Desulfosarcina variabilis str. Montpellier]|uniref:cytidylyltransferase domain-containing protein n=1 Tax=Desulfosarcina variabilis TaxID=2300 RepID=UPI003AFB6644